MRGVGRARDCPTVLGSPTPITMFPSTTFRYSVRAALLVCTRGRATYTGKGRAKRRNTARSDPRKSRPCQSCMNRPRYRFSICSEGLRSRPTRPASSLPVCPALAELVKLKGVSKIKVFQCNRLIHGDIRHDSDAPSHSPARSLLRTRISSRMIDVEAQALTCQRQ